MLTATARVLIGAAAVTGYLLPYGILGELVRHEATTDRFALPSMAQPDKASPPAAAGGKPALHP
ncbi:hypothetical protein [Streptomyces albireticuli]|uniref:hypothetical protein n=1 Tax=Streptomyces albireticuli TaxID=1940 RepID=UPI00368EF48A